MKIESLIRRKNGTVVDLDENRYHFKPEGADPRHLADVTVKAHIARFLQIPEGFQVADEDATFDPVDPPGPVTATLAGVQDKDGTVRTLAQLEEVELRAIALELEIENAITLSVEALIEAIQAEEVEIDGIDTSKPAEQPEQADDEPDAEDKAEEPAAVLSREALAEQYKAKFNKLPHHKLSAERIAQILAEEESE